MRAFLALALLATPASSVAQIAPKAAIAKPSSLAPPRLDCLSARVRHANKGEPLRPRRLDELPRGELYLSVMREVDGCQEVVRASEERARTLRR